jgi:DNA-binding transcriptional regulator YiaG
LASRSPESQACIQKMADELLLETQLQLIREELEISQKELAETLGNKTTFTFSNRKSWQ